MAFDLGKMVGPLPLGAWIAAVAGSLGLAVVLNRQGGGAAEEGTTAPDAPPTPTADTIFVVDRTEGAGNVNQPAARGAFESNNEWRLWIATNLVGRGLDASKVDGALNRYLRGDDCVVGDSEIISAALGLAFPPDPVPVRPPCPAAIRPGPSTPAPVPAPVFRPPVRTPTTPTKPPPPPVKSPAPSPSVPSTSYVIVSGDTLSGIAQRFYGDASIWRELYYANGSVLNAANAARGKPADPDLIFPGTRITLPGTLRGVKRK